MAEQVIRGGRPYPWKKDENGDVTEWGVRVEGVAVEVGQTVHVRTKAGKEFEVEAVEVRVFDEDDGSFNSLVRTEADRAKTTNGASPDVAALTARLDAAAAAHAALDARVKTLGAQVAALEARAAAEPF